MNGYEKFCAMAMRTVLIHSGVIPDPRVLGVR